MKTILNIFFISSFAFGFSGYEEFKSRTNDQIFVKLNTTHSTGKLMLKKSIEKDSTLPAESVSEIIGVKIKQIKPARFYNITKTPVFIFVDKNKNEYPFLTEKHSRAYKKTFPTFKIHQSYTGQNYHFSRSFIASKVQTDSPKENTVSCTYYIGETCTPTYDSDGNYSGQSCISDYGSGTQKVLQEDRHWSEKPVYTIYSASEQIRMEESIFYPRTQRVTLKELTSCR